MTDTDTDTDTSPVILINVFTVDPANQSELVELLTRATSDSVRHVPGFLGSTLHRSIDGTKVAMYARWADADAYAAMRSNPEQSPYLDRALEIAEFAPGMYEIAAEFAPA
ncbi:MAG TPA: antibiotic biosynthesis monooxygenase family protein [Pseudolysinimonas sp.]